MAHTRQDVTFKSEGLNCKGWLYLPAEDQGQEKPAIVMAHGFSAVKEMHLPNFAEKFTDAGFVVLVFDYRYTGEGEGEPRQHVIPTEQHKDYRNAITWISQHPEVDEERIGIWGSSYSGGHVLHIAAIDRRVKAVVSQVPLVNGWKNAQRLMRPDVMVNFINDLNKYRKSRYNGGEVQHVAVVAPEGEPSALPTPDSYEWFTITGDTIAPNWRNEVTLETMESFLEYNPAGLIEIISPTPLLMVVAENDVLTPTDLAIEAFGKAREPKELAIIPGGHFDAYTEPGLSYSATPAVEWFKKYLKNKKEQGAEKMGV
ncbi:alpha/beta hydrolase [Aneurinibacillus tyrosinisolvens]|uniref:alpha/beta hydrolase n=1 Tax=Aneurinibacillus tyrosinisolvens TaxID=1443435 RepID=UPI00063FA4DF|nr:alpha/beta hydrolase [Aneurinibacillus tyrosinisolvens]